MKIKAEAYIECPKCKIPLSPIIADDGAILFWCRCGYGRKEFHEHMSSMRQLKLNMIK